MKTSLCFLLAAFLALALRAQEAATPPARSGVNLVPGPATVHADNVNVRGQPSFSGEVITKLSQGTVVTVLEVIVREKAAPNEPAQWVRIQMPTNAPVFVFAQFLDATNKTVKPARLNLRAGPGENFSVVGRLNRGDQVTELLTKDGWTQIEAPTNAFAYVAAEFVVQAPPVMPPVPEVTPPPSPTAPEPSPVVPPASETNAPSVITPPATNTVSAEAPVPPQPSPVVPPTPETNAPPVIAQPSTNTVPAEVPMPPTPAADTNQPALFRVVIREGIVRATISIQAPSEWELADVRHRRTIAFLVNTNPAVKLVRLWEKRVRVTGIESVERRWPTTPLLTFQQIEPVTE